MLHDDDDDDDDVVAAKARGCELGEGMVFLTLEWNPSKRLGQENDVVGTPNNRIMMEPTSAITLALDGVELTALTYLILAVKNFSYITKGTALMLRSMVKCCWVVLLGGIAGFQNKKVVGNADVMVPDVQTERIANML